MKMNITRWQPDTCKCIIEYEWDGDADPTTRTHSVVNTIPCEFHTKHSNHEEVFEDVKAENTRKNVVINELNKEVDWEYDDKRELKIDLSSLSEAEKIDARDKLSKHGKVKEWQKS